jgi:hypothetical protein
MTDGVGVFVGVGVSVGVGVGVGVFVGMGVGVGVFVGVGVDVGKNGNESPLQANAGKATNKHISNNLMRFISPPPYRQCKRH